MSEFFVKLRKINMVKKHSNADSLEICELENIGYQFITKIDSVKEGDLVVYFPIDSILPDPISEKIGVKPYLHGSEKNRVKTAKLRGEYSQGVIANFDYIKEFLPEEYQNKSIQSLYEDEVDFTELLNIEKYDAELHLCKVKMLPEWLFKMPSEVKVFDLENCEYYKNEVQFLLDSKLPVWVSEKLEGTNFSILYSPWLPDEENIFVNTRRNSIKPDKDNTYWKASIKEGLNDKIQHIYKYLKNIYPDTVKHILLRGELIGPGIQGNIYKLNNYKIMLFGLEYSYNRFLNTSELFSLAHDFDLELAPTLHIGRLNEYLNEKTVREASNGYSVLNAKTLREGIVIVPLEECLMRGYDRFILKQRSPEYLAKEK